MSELPSRRSIKRAATKAAPSPEPKAARKGKRPRAPGVALHNDQVHAETQAKRNEALAMRIRSVPVSTIARQLGVSEPTVYRYIADALKEIPRANAKEKLAIELAKLEQRELATNIQLGKKDLKSSEFAQLQNTLTRISDQRCRLEGLYAPEKREHSFADQITTDAIRGMSEEDLKLIAAGDFSRVMALLRSKPAGTA